MLPSLVYIFFELNTGQDEIRQASLIKQIEWIEWFCLFLLISGILELFTLGGGGGEKRKRLPANP